MGMIFLRVLKSKQIFIMVLITGHCFVFFYTKIMYVSQKLNGLNNFESVKTNRRTL